MSLTFGPFFFSFPISEKNVNLEKCGQTYALFLAKFSLFNYNSVTSEEKQRDLHILSGLSPLAGYF